MLKIFRLSLLKVWLAQDQALKKHLVDAFSVPIIIGRARWRAGRKERILTAVQLAVRTVPKSYNKATAGRPSIRIQIKYVSIRG